MIQPEKLEYIKVLEPLSRTKSSKIEVFTDYSRLVATALAHWTREEEYFSVQKRYKNEEMQTMSKAMAVMTQEMEKAPFEDLLWPYYTEVASQASVKQRGEFYTPPAICELLAKISMNAEKIISEGKPVTMSEPTCWSGGIILKAGKQLAPKEEGAPSYVDLLRVDAIDVNPTACDMTFINTSLWGIPTRVTHGNALSMETWNVWENLHWKRVGENERLAMKEMIRLLAQSTPEGKDEETKPSESRKAPWSFETNHDIVVPKREGQDGQWEMDF